MTRTGFVGAVGVLLLAVGGAARAQTAQPAPSPRPLSETLGDEAESEYEAARQLLAEGDFEGALVRFTRLYAQVPDPRLLANIALCEKNLSRCARATTHFDAALSAGAGFFSPGQVADVRAMIHACSLRLGRLRVRGAPAGATVEIDDVAVGPAAVSSEIVVDAGPHRVRVAKAGYPDFVASIVVVAGARTDLAVHPAASAGPGVSSAGRRSPGATASGAARPSPGAAVSSATRPSPEETTLSEAAVSNPSLPPGAAPTSSGSQGGIAVRAEPQDTVMLDGNVVGKGRWEGRVAAGLHTISVSADGMEPYHADVRVTAYQTRTLDVTLAPQHGAPAWIWVTGGALVLTGVVVAIVSVFHPADPVPPPSAPAISTAVLRLR